MFPERDLPQGKFAEQGPLIENRTVEEAQRKEGSLARSPAPMMDHYSWSSSTTIASASTSLSNPIRSIAKHLLRFGRKSKDGSSLFTRSELAEDDTATRKNVISGEAAESLLAQAFAGVSAVKAAYAQLQIAQTPYDPDAIQRSDRAVVSELRHLSYLKHAYLSGCNQFSQESRIFAEIQERRNVIRTFETTVRNMESLLADKERELRTLREKLLESEEENRALEENLRSESSLSTLCNLHISGLDPTHFLKALRRATSSVRHFVQHLASSTQPMVFVESRVCNHVFSDFGRQHFGLGEFSSSQTLDRRRFFDEFAGLQVKSLRELLDGEGERERLFQGFCRAKFESLRLPNTARVLFLPFAEMARRVWLLHLLFFSFEPEAKASIFVVPRGCRYSEVYMESVGRDVAAEGTKVVGFTVVPGFKVRRTVIQCKVYLDANGGRSG